MKKIMALTASVSLLALFALATQAGAQGEPTATVDPEYVSSAGSHHGDGLRQRLGDRPGDHGVHWL